MFWTLVKCCLYLLQSLCSDGDHFINYIYAAQTGSATHPASKTVKVVHSLRFYIHTLLKNLGLS